MFILYGSSHLLTLVLGLVTHVELCEAVLSQINNLSHHVSVESDVLHLALLACILAIEFTPGF
jgi:hypothetical protein